MRPSGSVHAIPVNLAGSRAGYEDMPVVVRAIRRGVNRNHGRACIVLPIKEQQLDGGCSAGEYAEIDTVRENCSSERVTLPRNSSTSRWG